MVKTKFTFTLSLLALLLLFTQMSSSQTAPNEFEALGAELTDCPAPNRQQQHASYLACHPDTQRHDGDICGTITSKARTAGLIVPKIDQENLYCVTHYDQRRQRSYPCCAARLRVLPDGSKQHLPVDYTEFDAQFFE